MPAARYWRVVGVETYGGGELDLSELQLFSATSRVDESATLSCSHTPVSGSLSALADGVASATCTFGSSQVRSSGFSLLWDFGGAPADVTGVRPGSGALLESFVAQLTLQSFVSGAWVTYGTFGRYLWPGAMALTAEPVTVSVIPAVFDPAVKSARLTLSNGDRVITANSVGYSGARSTVGRSSGKYYLEMTRNAADMMVGISNATPNTSSYIGADGNSMGLWRSDVYLSGGVAGVFSFANVAAPIGMLVDADARTLRYKVGTTVSTSIAIPWSGGIYLAAGNGASSAWSTFSITLNAGQEPFSYEVPDGYLAGFGPLTSGGGTGFGDPIIRTARAVPLLAASSAVLAFSSRTSHAQVARDVEFGGPGTIYGTTKTKGTPNLPTKARVVLLHQRSKLPVRETWSDPTTGYFEFRGIDVNQQFLTLAEDAAGNFRPVAANRLTPEVLA